MEPEERETTFEEVDHLYAELKRRHEDGALSDEEFDARLKELMVQDDEGRWWAKSRRTGDWHYHDGDAWVKGTPPTKDQNQGEQRRATRRWIMVGAPFAALVVAVVAVVAFVSFIGNSPNTGQSSNPGDGRQASQPPNSRVVFKDNFSESSAERWSQVKKEHYGYYTEKGHYRIYLAAEPTSDIYWTRPNLEVTDQENAIVEVDATRAGDAPGNPSSNWGIVCRDNGSGNYLMGISDAGYPIITRVNKDGSFTTLARKSSYEGHAIQKDGATNHIRGECVGSKLTLYVNDAKVLELEDSKLSGSGQVGLYVHNVGFAPPDTDVYFDNFRLSVP